MKSEKRKMSFSIAVLLTLIIVLGGCGSVMLDAKTPISAEPEKALVIFVRSTAIFAGERTRLWDGDKFIGELAEYKNITGCDVIVVFDSYKYPKSEKSRSMHKGIEIIFS